MHADEVVLKARGMLKAVAVPPDAAAFEAGKEIMERLRSQHMVLGSTMESMVQVRACVCEVLYCAVLCRAVLCCDVLCCAVLCCAVLCCVVLC
jgi:hypothetical protein